MKEWRERKLDTYVGWKEKGNDLTPGREPEECEESGGAPDCGGNECHLVALVGTSATALVEDGQLVISTLNWIDRSDFSVGTFPSRLKSLNIVYASRASGLP